MRPTGRDTVALRLFKSMIVISSSNPLATYRVLSSREMPRPQGAPASQDILQDLAGLDVDDSNVGGVAESYVGKFAITGHAEINRRHIVYVTSEVEDLVHLVNADTGSVEREVVVGTRPRRFVATSDIKLAVIRTEMHVAGPARCPEILDDHVRSGVDDQKIVSSFIADEYEPRVPCHAPSRRSDEEQYRQTRSRKTPTNEHKRHSGWMSLRGGRWELPTSRDAPLLLLAIERALYT
jgi:hypothetical protein